MQKKFKIMAVVLIAVSLALSLVLCLTLQGILTQAKEDKAMVEKKDEIKNEKVSAILADLKISTNIGFNSQAPIDFEWQYIDNGKLVSFNIVGSGISANNAREGLVLVKYYFEEKGFVLDQENIMAGPVSGLYGYYREDIACIVTGVKSELAPEEPKKEIDGKNYDIEVQCGQLSEQDIVRLAGAGDDADRMREEYEVAAIVRSYIYGMSDFSVLNGGNIDIDKIKKLDCPGCWEAGVNFEIDNPDDRIERLTLAGTVSLDDWIAVSNTLNYPVKKIITLFECGKLGGLATTSEEMLECPVESKEIGIITNEEQELICCQELL